MERGLSYERIFPGTEAAYDQRRRDIWPDLVEEIRASGIRQLTAFRRGTDVWTYGEFELGARSALDILGDKPAKRRWDHDLRDVVAQVTTDAGEPILYEEVFHTNEGPALAGPMRRGLLSLVIDPDRAAEYDALHADPWPDLIAALADSGFRNYSGFRRGAHVVYYGEYYPDMATVFRRMAEHDVDARWGKAFEDIITTIRGPDGWLITADEVYHLEG